MKSIIISTISKNHSNPDIDIKKIFKVLLMSIIMFSILLLHNSIRILKDSIIIQDFGAEAISFIKLWLEIPFVTCFVLVYYWLYNWFSVEKIFRVIILFYIGFYLLFAFEIYPNKSHYHLNYNTLVYMTNMFPNLKWFLIILGNWSITLFYLFGETWSTVAFSLLFWQLANRITSLNESKIIYPYFNFLGQINLLIAGYIVQNIYKSFIVYSFLSTNNIKLINLQSIVILVSFLGFLIVLSHYLLEKVVLKNQFDLLNNQSNTKKMGVFESIKMVTKHRTLTLISLSIISYHICMNLIEGIWFAKVWEFYISSEKFISYQGKVLFYTGICGIAFAVLSKYLLSHFKWLVSAIITPYIVLTLGTAFFVSILLVSYFEFNENYYLYIVVLIGLIQNVLIKGSKYGIYDSVKEMQYIPLDDNIKSRGKAAVDVISTNLGKSLGSLCQFTVFFTFPSVRINDIVIILMIFFLLSSFVWINVTYKLSEMIDTERSLINRG